LEENFVKMMASQPPLTADLLVQKIYTLLEENIINMVLPPESKLVEENIARALGVSRSPVREVLIQLENAGLVVRRAGKGRVVASFTEQELINNYQVWEMAESYTCGLACLTATEEDFRKIAEILEQMGKLSGSEEDFRAYRLLNYRFHSQMAAPCPNKTLIRIYENALKPVRWCWNLSLLWKGDVTSSYEEHREVFDAYRTRNRKAFEKLVRKHCQAASARFRKEYTRRKNASNESVKTLQLGDSPPQRG